MLGGEHRRGQALGVGVDGEAEQHELHDGHDEHHGEGQPVAAELQRLLDDHGPEPGEEIAHAASSALSCAWPIRWMNTSSSVGRRLLPVKAAERKGRTAAPQRVTVRPADMERGAEGRGGGDARHVAQLRCKAVGARAGRDQRRQAGVRDDLVRRAARHQPAIGDVGDLVAALGLVHVMGGDEHGDALRGQRVDLVPEGAPRLGVDARGRLVEQQQLRLVQHAGRKRQALLPAAGQRARQLVLARGEAQPLERLVHHLAQVAQAVEPADELEVLADGQVFIEAEALRHVAGLRLDLVALA